MNSKKLTNLEAIMLIAGTGLGIGMLTIPYAIQEVGIVGTIIAVLLAFIGTMLLNFYLVDLTINSNYSRDIVDILKDHLFKGSLKKFFSFVFFGALAFIVIEDMVVYTICAAELLSTLFSLNPVIVKAVFSVLASSMLFAGLKNIGVGEKFIVSAIGIVVLILGILSYFNINNSIPLYTHSFGKAFALYGLFMFAFCSMFSMVQVTAELENKSDLKKVVIIGLLINAIITLIYSFAAILCSKEITELSTIGIIESLNMPFVSILCTTLVLFALITSYWTTSFALIDAMNMEFKINRNICIVICVLVALTISLFLPLTIIDHVQVVAAALSVLFGIVIVPAYFNSIKKTDRTLLLGKFARSKAIMIIVSILIIMMAISSFVPLD